MPRRERPAKTERSEHWLRVAVNERTEQLNELIERKFSWSTKDPITWLSPLKSDDYAEYYDDAFLNELVRPFGNRRWPHPKRARVGTGYAQAPAGCCWSRRRSHRRRRTTAVSKGC
jgi:hypothetical protein